MSYIPYVVEQTENGERGYDIYSRLLESRIIMLNGEINDDVSNTIISQLLYLESKSKTEDIYMYINSPGGVITSGLAMLDTMNHIECDIHTICIGQAASMGSFLLSAGTPGKRSALENSRIMIHQPLGGASGQATDIQIQAQEIQRMKDILNYMLHVHTGQDIETLERDTDRDNFMSAFEAKEYGLIDKVIKSKTTKYQYDIQKIIDASRKGK